VVGSYFLGTRARRLSGGVCEVKCSDTARFVPFPESVLSESYDRYHRYDGLHRYNRNHLHAPRSSFDFFFSLSLPKQPACVFGWSTPLFYCLLIAKPGDR
jgi:hypothetical protein